MLEQDRIGAAYERRKGSERYSSVRPDVVRASAARAEGWTTALWGSGHELGAFLDVGCGTGAVLAWAIEAGAQPVVGVDLLESRFVPWRWAAGLGGGAAADGAALPFAASTFDTVSCSTLFSSILDDGMARGVAAEVERVLRPSGVVLWHDLVLPNPANRDVRRVGRAAIQALFPGRRLRLRRAVLAPPLARRLTTHPVLSGLAEQLPPARSHLSGALFPGA